MTAQSGMLPIPGSLKMALDVERGLREQQADIFFVKSRVIRRVLQTELDISSSWQPPPQKKCCVISRDRLVWLVARDELGVDLGTQLPDKAVLIAQPDEDQLSRMTRLELLRYYWRQMFRGRIEAVMINRTKPDQLPIAELRRRIDRLGQTEFDEVRSVLRAEQLLIRPDDDRNVYAEFVGVYHEFSEFAPRSVPVYFPSLMPREDVLAVIGPECSAATLLNSTRPLDLSLNDILPSTTVDAVEPILKRTSGIEVTKKRSERQFARLSQLAERLSLKGNNVRASLVYLSAADVAPDDTDETSPLRNPGRASEAAILNPSCNTHEVAVLPPSTRQQQNYSEPITDAHEPAVPIPTSTRTKPGCAGPGVTAEIRKLVDRLQSALELSDKAAEPWLKMCEALLVRARHGFWNANARLLYDLQNVCFDREHVTYKVDLWRWMVSFGKSPLKRPLSRQRVVLMSKHLRAAARRVPYVEIDREGRRVLSDLLHEAADAAEQILRVRLEPLIQRALTKAGFEPKAVVERIALQKMVRELGDEVVDRGFITLGNLRDSVSRNPLKMSDLKSVDEFFFVGDPLLRADRLLAKSLDGVYQRGPFYLRWLQKINSLAFGVPAGRLFSLYVALPFGLAFLLLRTVEIAVEHLAIVHLDSGVESGSGEKAELPQQHHVDHVDVVYTHQMMVALGFVILSLIHFPRFRRFVMGCLSKTWSALRLFLIDLPSAVLHWRVVDRVLNSFPVMLLQRFVLTPTFVTVLFWILFPKLGFYGELNRWWGLGIFCVSFAVLNSRLGRDTEEVAREYFGRTWYRIRVHLLLGLLILVIDIFRISMDGLERLLYAVDEMLRFRSDESRLMLGIKAVFGLVWGGVHGVIRFCLTLLIEPQMNPLKHFPVVTVSHKLALTTLSYPISQVLNRVFEPTTAYAVTALILGVIPGIFGFLAWELKENWKLYKANRSPNLRAVPVGDHGETLQRLLRPGFHSGIIPRLFAKQRRAIRDQRAPAVTSQKSVFVERLHHEAKVIRHFIERDLLALLEESRTFRSFRLTVDNPEIATNRIQIRIHEASFTNQPVRLEFSEQSGWLVGGTRETGWLDQLEPEDANVFRIAVTGLYKLAAVELVRQQIERQLVLPLSPSRTAAATPGAALPTTSPSAAVRSAGYDISPLGLVVWPHGQYEFEIHYPLDESPVTHPRPRYAARAAGLEPLPAKSLIFGQQELTWDEWTHFWESERDPSTLNAKSSPAKPFTNAGLA